MIRCVSFRARAHGVTGRLATRRFCADMSIGYSARSVFATVAFCRGATMPSGFGALTVCFGVQFWL
jgi:hypothetical protein